MGTPYHKLSRMEFHPQWDTNPPTAEWDSTATCGAHPTTFPMPAVRSKNPSGNTSSGLSYSPDNSRFSCGGGRRRDHRNRCPLCSSACAISFTWSASKLPKLPKHKKTTEEGGWSSNQEFSRHGVQKTRDRKTGFGVLVLCDVLAMVVTEALKIEREAKKSST
ncbi:hypothetical protein RJ640_009877 [Escallonia rubra]|uniref:Uncharacterized protein n=1 Tax=Escallonia rubra TaxID=112253 RepID=A0AA88S5I8_9ASTE|nr:hypothetical protein RJ640_009877 [Escallonia rubra]